MSNNLWVIDFDSLVKSHADYTTLKGGRWLTICLAHTNRFPPGYISDHKSIIFLIVLFWQQWTGVQNIKIEKILVRSDAGTKVQWMLQWLNSYSCLALAVTSDGNIDQLGNGDDGDLSVQDDAKKRMSQGFLGSDDPVVLWSVDLSFK